MKKREEEIREYAMSDGHLKQVADGIVDCMIRDAAEFLLRGYDEVRRNLFVALIADFEDIPPDIYYESQKMIKTEAKEESRSVFDGIIRTIMVLPILVPAVAIGSMWRLMYNYEFGIFNQALKALGLPPQIWLGSAELAMPSVIVVDVWHWVPFVFLIMLAGLEALPVEVFEAASVDGASGWQKLRLIILPLMWPTISVALMFRTIFAFKVFDEIFLLTSGGPGTATEVVSLYIYKVFFGQNQLGYGALVAIVSISIICVFVFTFRSARWGMK